MRRWIHVAPLLAPVVLWGVWVALTLHGRSRTERQMWSPDGLVWTGTGGEIRASLRVADEGERQRLWLELRDGSGAPQYEREFLIDWDLGGGGFLAAMQADADPELEIVYATRARPGDACVLDLSSGRVEERDLSTALPGARQLASDWLDSHVLNPVAFGFWSLLTLAFYVFYLPGFWIGRRMVRWWAGRHAPR